MCQQGCLRAGAAGAAGGEASSRESSSGYLHEGAPHHDKTLCQGLHHILVVLVKVSSSLLPTAELLLQTGKPISLPLNCSLQQSAHGHHLLTASLPSTNWLPCGRVLVASTELHIKGATRQQQRTVLLWCLPSPKLEVSLIQSPGSAWSSAEVESKL